MCPSWMWFCSVLVLFAGFSETGRCPIGVHESSSLLLDSLRCYNNYRSYFYCKWREPKNLHVQLWFKRGNSRMQQCLRYSDPRGGASEPGTAQCRYNTTFLKYGFAYTFFFLEDKTQQFWQREAVDISQELRTWPPVDLYASNADEGGCRLSWSRPYPPSSPLSEDTAYQLDYRRARRDKWMTRNVSNTSVRLDRLQSLQGCKYEAQVRARVSPGQWSHWFPAASGTMEKAVGGGPHAHPIPRCVLLGEAKVECSWSVSAEVPRVISHQLLCCRNRTTLTEGCCVNQRVNSDPGGRVLDHSCLLSVVGPGNLLLELLPARTFMANQQIRPDPPEHVTVREKGSNWVVNWTVAMPLDPESYQLCYHRKEEEDCSFHNIQRGAMTYNIPQASLVPSQEYRVKVRSLVVAGDRSDYGGIPSEWSIAVTWTSHAASWSPSTLIYVFISMCVAVGFFAIYWVVMSCQREVSLWADSIPSPGKSKILSEIKAAKSWSPTLSQKPFLSKDQYADVLTRSTDVSLWSNKSGERKHSHQDDGCWECDKQPFICDHGNGPDAPCMGFSGLYILCWESQIAGVGVTPSSAEDPAALTFTVGERDYVCLPGHGTCSSAQHHFSHDGVGTNPRQDRVEQQQGLQDTGQIPDEAVEEQDFREPLINPPCSSSSSSSGGHPSAYTLGPFTGWPQGVSMQASGYCQLPTGHT